jgi:DNA-directed RNA polymerase specialized sigma24 family protein
MAIVKSIPLAAARPMVVARARTEKSSTADQRFSVLIENYSDVVVNTCHHYLRDVDDAHDVAQEVFLAAFRHFDGISDESAWRTRLYRTASHKSLNTLCSRKRRAWLRLDLLSRSCSTFEGHVLHLARIDRDVYAVGLK